MGTESGKQERRAARALVTTYYEAELAGLIEHVAEALERYRSGELDASQVDDLIHRYGKAARELWKFCWSGGVGSNIEFVARALEWRVAEGDAPDWWEAAAPRERS